MIGPLPNSTPRFEILRRAGIVPRLLLALVAVSAVRLSNEPLGRRMIAAGLAYIAAALLLWVFASGRAYAVLPYAGVVIDVAYVALLQRMLPVTLPARWVLYFIPIALAAGTGRRTAAFAGVVGVLTYAAVARLFTPPLALTAIWPVVLLCIAVLGLLTVPSGRSSGPWDGAMPESDSEADELLREGSAEEVAGIVVDRAMQATSAEAAWLVWLGPDKQMQLGPIAGAASGQILLTQVPGRRLLEKLEQGPVALEEVLVSPMTGTGTLVALGTNGARAAFLGVEWQRAPRGRDSRRRGIESVQRWATDVLAQAEVRAALRESLDREAALRQTAVDWAATLNPLRAQESALRGVQTGLGATAVLVERSSGRLVVGDTTVGRSLGDADLTWISEADDADASVPDASEADVPVITALRGNLALATWRPGAPLNDTEIAWLRELSIGLGATLERCSDFERSAGEVERLRASIEAMPSPLALWHRDGELALANREYSTLGLGELPPAGPVEQLEVREINVGVPARTFVLSVAPVLGGLYSLAHYREITRERDALRAKDELISTVGHELRSPLTSILGYSQMMSRQLGVVQSQVSQLDRLINDLMEASRLESGQLPLARELVDVAELSRRAVERFRGGHEGRPLRISAAKHLLVVGDATRLGQVLDNLLDNAAKYSPPDSEIALEAQESADEVLILVRDHGIGIKSEHLPSLFDRFYRVPEAVGDETRGFGLGLSIVRDLVAAHGGRVWAESAGEGQGSTFCVALPTPKDTTAVKLEEAAPPAC